MDELSTERRSSNMRQIRSKDTAPEAVSPQTAPPLVTASGCIRRIFPEILRPQMRITLLQERHHS